MLNINIDLFFKMKLVFSFSVLEQFKGELQAQHYIKDALCLYISMRRTKKH